MGRFFYWSILLALTFTPRCNVQYFLWHTISVLFTVSSVSLLNSPHKKMLGRMIATVTIHGHCKEKYVMEVNGDRDSELLFWLTSFIFHIRKLYRFGTAWGWANDDIMFNFGWTISLRMLWGDSLSSFAPHLIISIFLMNHSRYLDSWMYQQIYFTIILFTHPDVFFQTWMTDFMCNTKTETHKYHLTSFVYASCFDSHTFTSCNNL